MRVKRVVIWLVFIMILLVVLAGVAWYARMRIAGANASDQSYGLINSPSNGDIVFKGDPVYVDASFLTSHRNPTGLQLYIDGAKYVLDEKTQPFSNQKKLKCPSDVANFCGLIDTRMLWIAMDAGRYVLSACMTGNETQGPAWSVCTDGTTIVVTDLKVPPGTGGTYLPQPGDTLESVANKFGFPPLLVAAGNPGIEPAAELPGSVPVNIPADPSLSEAPPGPGSPVSPWMLDKVTMHINLPVDKVYCYYSFGENFWSRMPAGPQSFAYPSNGQLDLTGEFRSLTIPPAGASLALECWGWNGPSIVPLGSGKTTLTPSPSAKAQLQGDNFNLVGTLVGIPGNSEPLDKKQIIPPPVGLTSTSKADICIKHFPPEDFFFGPFACKNAIETGDTILIWDWLAPLFPPDDPTVAYVTKIDGYHVYQIGAGGKPSLIGIISLANKKTEILSKKSFGSGTFMVRAYKGPLESANSNIYTLGGATSGLATVTIKPSVELYGGAEKHRESGQTCSVGLAGIVGSPSVGSSEIAVGFDHLWPEDSCLTYREEYSRAQVVFDLGAIKGPVSSAKLSYREDYTSKPGQSCARELREITTTTSGAAMRDLASDPYAYLPTYGYSGGDLNVDVTYAIRDWTLGTPNAGFLFRGSDESLPADCGGLTGPGCIGGGTESCWTAYSKVLLTVTYFVK